MAALPAWFLHSRTAFETVMMVGFYAVFVLAYLLYREVSAAVARRPLWSAGPPRSTATPTARG